MKRILGPFVLSFAAMFVLVGCAGVPMASKDRDSAAKSFTPKPDKAQIYVYRNEIFGSAVRMVVSLDDRVKGQTGAKTFFWWEVEPGEHKVSSHTENTVDIALKTEPNKLYFIWQEVKMGMWGPRSLLHQVDEQTGKLGVMESELIQEEK